MRCTQRVGRKFREDATGHTITARDTTQFEYTQCDARFGDVVLDTGIRWWPQGLVSCALSVSAKASANVDHQTNPSPSPPPAYPFAITANVTLTNEIASSPGQLRGSSLSPAAVATFLISLLILQHGRPRAVQIH